MVFMRIAIEDGKDIPAKSRANGRPRPIEIRPAGNGKKAVERHDDPPGMILGQVYPLFFRNPGMSNGSIAAP